MNKEALICNVPSPGSKNTVIEDYAGKMQAIRKQSKLMETQRRHVTAHMTGHRFTVPEQSIRDLHPSYPIYILAMDGLIININGEILMVRQSFLLSYSSHQQQPQLLQPRVER